MQKSKEVLAQVRNLMKENNIDVLVVPDSDPHMNEYVPDHWRVISWLTGFSGSSATVVISSSEAGLWTDSRYEIQAEDQLKDSGYRLMKPVSPDKNSYLSWININVPAGSTIGFDDRLFSAVRYKKLKDAAISRGISINHECDFITPLWTDRPALPVSKAFEHAIEFAGMERADKISAVRNEMSEEGVNYHLLTAPDDIMWLLNIRGGDIRYSPVLLSYAIIGEEQILLFADEAKIPFKTAREFDRIGVIMLPYEEAAGMLTTLEDGSSILVSPSTTSAELYMSIPEGVRIIEDLSIPARLKAIKNGAEESNLEKAMIRDGVAMTRFFHWVELNAGTVPMSEMSLTEKLNHFRAEQENFLSLSFSSIVAWNEHSALPHYNAVPDCDSVIGQEGLLLADSGSQYHEGTTDITRTVPVGRPSPVQKKDYTLVLKGMISLACAVFPEGTTGVQLDILARTALWKNGLNYGHGTGHGVGFCLNVHEGPQSISPSVSSGSKSILPGMLISDEPGIYRQGEYGIRIENLVLCKEHERTEFGRFLSFRTMSLCYIEKELIDLSILDSTEISWLNEYHARVYEKLSPLLDEELKAWLKEKTAPLSSR